MSGMATIGDHLFRGMALIDMKAAGFAPDAFIAWGDHFRCGHPSAIDDDFPITLFEMRPTLFFGVPKPMQRSISVDRKTYNAPPHFDVDRISSIHIMP